MIRRHRSRSSVLVLPVLLALSAATFRAGAAADAPAEPPRAAANAATTPEPACSGVDDCEAVVGTAAGMAVPLVAPWLRGDDGGWDRFTLCCAQVNPGRGTTVTGLLNGRPAAVVPSGGSQSDGRVTARGTATVVYAVSGRSYRLARYSSLVAREPRLDLVGPTWEVGSDVYTWSCVRRAAVRDPVADCGTGTHQYTRGRVRTPGLADAGSYTVTVPISYYARVVDSRGRPLATPYRRSTGHWLLQAQERYHGWMWTVEWSVGGIGVGRVAGSSYASGTRTILTDGPFR